MTAVAVLIAADTEGPGQPYISPDDLASIQPLWDEAVEEHLMPLVAGVWDDSAGMIHAEMLDATDVDFPFPSVGSVTAEEYLAQARNVYGFIGDELWQTARAQLEEGFAAGDSIPQLVDRLQASAGLTARRATLVARSTVIEAANAGAIATARAAGIEMQKEWIATPDERTRPTHHTADGQKVALADPFTVGGFSADVPGDPGLPPQEKYNCRCTVGFVMADAVAKKAKREAQPELPLPGTSGAVETPAAVAPPAQAAPTAPDRAAVRKAARARQKAIADTEPVARFAAEIDNIARARAGLPFDDKATKLLMQRLAQAEAEGIASADLAAVRAAVEARDLARVRAEAQRYAASRGLTPVGSAGERLPFDAARMQPVEGAAAIADGDLVEVIRQGHVLTLTGEEIQLDRAVVARVTADSLDAMKTPSLQSLAGEYEIPNYRTLNRDDLLRELRAVGAQSPAQARAALLAQRAEAERVLAERYAQFPIPDGVPDLGSIFDDGARLLASDPKYALGAALDPAPWELLVGGEFSGGITAVDVSATLVRVGNSRELAIILQGELKRRGRTIGQFSRSYGRKANGDLVASHTWIQISKGAQGSGFSNEFNGRLINWYRRSGVKSVELHADIDVGGYAWARSGYDFANQEAADKILARLASTTRRRTLAKRLIGAPDVDEQIRLGRELLKRAEGLRLGDDGFPTAFEISQLGRWPGAGKNDVWIGKLVMLGSDWMGVLRL